MNQTKDHNNWITVGEIINLIKKPIALYTSHIVQRWHTSLSKVILGRCPNPGKCQTKKKPGDLCPPCNAWYQKLTKSHRNKDERQFKWRENCDTSAWPDNMWEVAKFFMPILGGNKATTKSAESTDLSSLLNVLIWMKDLVFAPDKRVDFDLVKNLRSDVRNRWAHAPNQGLDDADFKNAFDTVIKFIADLDEVFSCVEVKQCAKDIQFVQAHGISNVVETELKTLTLLRDELGADFSQVKGDQQEHERRLVNLENRITQLQINVNVDGTEGQPQLKSCIPDKPLTFVGRDVEVKQIISSLVEDACGIVSIFGGPGFGKTTVAVEVSHHLSNKHGIVVIFSFLSNISTVSEVFPRLCRDVGVNPGDDPESSLMFWLKNLEKKVVLVMDNIEQLLESNMRSQFTELVLTLRKNSQQQLQILTTTRTAFSILDRSTDNIQIGELDNESSVELLRKCCPNEEVKDGVLFELAKLCVFLPLALCIAGSRIPDLDDPAELIQWLREKPMDVLQTSDHKQCVPNAIEFSFQMLSDKDKKALVRLSVYNGNFQRNSAQEVIERNGMKTQDFLKNLVARSLIQISSGKRFVIHSLIRRFLADHEQHKVEKALALGLMVKHFLKVCHLLTVDSYSKDGFTEARKKLKEDSHNIEETLRVCSEGQEPNLNPHGVIESLICSAIYKSSSRFFYNFSWDLLPQTVLRNFQESCIKLAKNQKQLAIEITFQCLVAHQEGHRSAWKSPEYINRMKAIKELFDRNEAVLKENRCLHQFCYYFYARYFSNIAENTPCADLPEDDLKPFSKDKDGSSFEKVDETFILIERGHLNKRRATKLFHSDRIKYKEYMECAKSFYDKALSSAKKLLGDHELTCACHKYLGDLYFTMWKNEEALPYYSDVIKLRRKLQLDSNEPFVYLLKNYGSCLCFLGHFDESVNILNEARDIADKLAERGSLCRANVSFVLARTCRLWKPDCQEAAKHANLAMEMKELLHPSSVKTLEEIIKTAEENMS